MTPHDRARELYALAHEDEHVAWALEKAPDIGDPPVGFHYRQAAEKLLKAVLAEGNVDFPYTHDLAGLLALVNQAGYEVPVKPDELASLTPFAVTLRYQTGAEVPGLNRPQVRQLVETLR